MEAPLEFGTVTINGRRFDIGYSFYDQDLNQLTVQRVYQNGKEISRTSEAAQEAVNELKHSWNNPATRQMSPPYSEKT